MKKSLLLSAAFTLVFGASVAHAADAPEVVSYEAKNGTVTFNHKAHQEKLSDCAKCHEGEPAKIEINKDVAHKMCKGCHTEMKQGPTKCGDCHKK